MQIQQQVVSPIKIKQQWHSLDIKIKILEQYPIQIMNCTIQLIEKLNKIKIITNSSLNNNRHLTIGYDKILCVGISKQNALIIIKNDQQNDQQYFDNQSDQDQCQINPLYTKINNFILNDVQGQQSIDSKCNILVKGNQVISGKQIYQHLSQQLQVYEQSLISNKQVSSHKSQLLSMFQQSCNVLQSQQDQDALQSQQDQDALQSQQDQDAQINNQFDKGISDQQLQQIKPQ